MKTYGSVSEIEEVTPPEQASNATNSLLPAKLTKTEAKTYEKSYSQFVDWRGKNKVGTLYTFSRNFCVAYFDGLTKTLEHDLMNLLWKSTLSHSK